MTVEALQKAMLEQPQVKVETNHAFMNGIYARQIIIPAGVVIVGAKHKTEHPYLISKGKCYIINNGKREYFEAPYNGITKPGSKRAIYAIEDTVFTTFHPTEETDIKKIESEIIEPEGLQIANNPVEVIK